MRHIKPDFSKLNSNLSENLQSSKSKDCWREFLLTVDYFVDNCSTYVNEEEIADVIKSLQNWTTKRHIIKYKEFVDGSRKSVDIKIGDIIYVDLGLNYKPECAYAHPSLVIGKIEGFLLVVPTSTSSQKINASYDEENNKTGKWYYKKVTKSQNFEDDCVLLLDNLRTISEGRILDIKQRIPDLSLIDELKQIIFKNYLSKQFVESMKLENECEFLKDENEKLRSDIAQLVKNVEELEKEKFKQSS